MNDRVKERTSRGQTIDRLGSIHFDVLVIGGGIVGAGVARDAALRGLSAALVEQHDFAFGTSSRSSRLVHGGLRYLAQGRIRLVRESSIEKAVLHRIAPHIVRPLPFIFPAYRDKGRPRWQLYVGVKLYDQLCGRHKLGRSRLLSASDVRQQLPELRADRLTGAVQYFDGQTNDARLVVDTLRSAANAGAVVTNYVRLDNAEPSAEGWLCQCTDVDSDRPVTVQARAVISATGPWAGRSPRSKLPVRPTKGVHLVVDRQRMSIDEAVVLSEDARILFVLPWGERVILGTTDTDYDGEPEDVCTEPADVQYILDVVNRAFPGLGLSGGDVRSTWAGLRPLIADASGKPSDVSRSHEIRMNEPGWWEVGGGKLTTYRLMAEQTVDAIVRFLGRPVNACTTAHQPLLPAEETDGISSVLPLPVSRNLIEHFCSREWALHLDDVLIRRAGWQVYHGAQFHQTNDVLEWMADFLGWDEQRRSQELYRHREATDHWSPSPSASHELDA